MTLNGLCQSNPKWTLWHAVGWQLLGRLDLASQRDIGLTSKIPKVLAYNPQWPLVTRLLGPPHLVLIIMLGKLQISTLPRFPRYKIW